MKLAIIILSLASFAVAAPQFPRRPQDGRHYRILEDVREEPVGGRFYYKFRTENGIDVNARGTPGSNGQSNINGGFSFPFPDGTVGTVTYVADENGYRAESPLIPTPHPLPAHAIEQIRFAESQRGFRG